METLGDFFSAVLALGGQSYLLLAVFRKVRIFKLYVVELFFRTVIKIYIACFLTMTNMLNFFLIVIKIQF